MATKKIPYKKLQAQLDEVMAELQGDVDIDRAFALHETALDLIGKLEAHLDAASSQIEKIKLKFKS